MIKSEISIVIKPISSLYDLLPNDNRKKYLKDLKHEYSEFIDDIYNIKPEPKYKIDEKISKLKFNHYIKDEGSTFNYIILPYDVGILNQAYPDISKNKIIDYSYEKVNNTEYMSNKIENHIRTVQSENTNLQYIKIVYHIPLYDTSQLEFRFKMKDIQTKKIQYKDIFNKRSLEQINKLPFVTNLDIRDKIDESIEDLFKTLKKSKSKNRKLLFLETLYNYSRNKQLREDYLLKSEFYKVLVLYSTDFIDKDVTILNKDYYYELPTVNIKASYFSDSEKGKDKFKDEYNQTTYKKGNVYRCIGKITNISKNKYKFSVKLKHLMFEDNSEDTIIIYLNIEDYLGIIHRYTIDSKNEFLDIPSKSKSGNLVLFNENDAKLFKYNNIDKSLGDNNELFIPKNYYLDKVSFEDFLTKKVTPSDFLKYFKSPTELKKYEVFLEQNYQKLKYDHTLQTQQVENPYYFKLWLNMLFEPNTPFHIKPRDSSTTSDTQYRLKLDDNILVYEIDVDKPVNYNDILNEWLDNKGIQKRYKEKIESVKPNYIIYVNLLLRKKDFKKTLYDCNEIRFKLLKHTKQLISGGKTKRKKLKYNKRNNKACITKRCLRRRYSRRKA